MGQRGFTGWAMEQLAREPGLAAVPGLGSALTQGAWILVGGSLHQLGSGKEHTAQKGEEGIAGWLCQGIGGASASQAVAQSSGA